MQIIRRRIGVRIDIYEVTAILSEISLFNLKKKYWVNYILETDERKRMI